jgi:hypothetical protein
MWLLTCLLSASIAAAPFDAAARDQATEEPGNLVTVSAALCTLVYSPVKLAYAASGLVIGSLAWMWSFGRRRVTRPIFDAALRGDYLITPEHLTGKRKLRFIGRRR